MFLEGSGIVITEPVTMLTDYVLAGQAWLYARWLRRGAEGHGSSALGKWVTGFYAAALGALAGGTLHGFQLMFSRSALIVLLLATVVGVAAGAFTLLEAGFASARESAGRDPLPRRITARWLWTMAGAASIGGLIALAGPSLHQHFNQNDLAHIVLMLGLYSGYRAASLREGPAG